MMRCLRRKRHVVCERQCCALVKVLAQKSVRSPAAGLPGGFSWPSCLPCVCRFHLENGNNDGIYLVRVVGNNGLNLKPLNSGLCIVSTR